MSATSTSTASPSAASTGASPTEMDGHLSKAVASDGSKIDPKLIVPFVSSVRDVFKTMVHVNTIVNRPEVKPHPCSTYDVSTVVQFGGEIRGSVVLSFEAEAAIRLVERFAGLRLSPGSEDFCDAVGELGNMVAGAAKKNLPAQATIGIPTVVIGPAHHIARLRDVPCLVIPCRSEVGQFAVEVSIMQAKQMPAAAADVTEDAA